MPGGAALGQQQGLENAQAILALNAMAGNIGQPGGVYLRSLHGRRAGWNTSLRPPRKQMAGFVKTLAAGKVKALFIHGVNPLFELPASFGLKDALARCH